VLLLQQLWESHRSLGERDASASRWYAAVVPLDSSGEVMSEFDRQKWNAKYAEGTYAPKTKSTDTPSEPSSFLTEIQGILLEHLERARACGQSPCALDVAGGTGRHALPLAKMGFAVTIADISDVGLEKARTLAAAEGLQVHCLAIDLEESPLPPAPGEGQWDLIFSSYFLRRQLYAQYHQALKPGGLLAVVQATMTNLQRFEKPPAPFLLEDGELPGLLVPAGGWEILSYREDWTDDGAYEARLLASRRIANCKMKIAK
jgi:tellurite methyltransferase